MEPRIRHLGTGFDGWDVLATLPHSVFLDGAAFHFLAFDPFLRLESHGEEIRLRDARGSVLRTMRGDPFTALRRVWQELGVRRESWERDDRFPPFCGGLCGYFGYEVGGLLERRLRAHCRNGDGIPDASIGFYDRVLCHEIATGRIDLIETAWGGDAFGVRPDPFERLEWALARSERGGCEREGVVGCETAEIEARFTRQGYLDAVRRALDAIAAGDIYQVNLSQRFTASTLETPQALYSRLRAQNPAPFGAYLQGEGYAILSNSPERFLRIAPEGGGWIIETEPIKGTRPRGETPAQDAARKEELRSDEKELAEHLMIVDLERNDLGKISEYGSVVVEERLALHTFPTLHHLISRVRGRLRPEIDPFSAIAATFPGGSVTGAPKIRAMEIIAELEPHPRGVYTGSIGYIDLSGRVDLNIAIRTALWRRGRLHFQVGGAVVADSRPEAEYEETLLKGKAFFHLVPSPRKQPPSAISRA